jgi:cobalt-zinc-cadmium efflux system protein
MSPMGYAGTRNRPGGTMADHHDHAHDDDDHDHDHGHHDHAGHSHGGHSHAGHGHHHGPASYDRAFAIGVILNTGFVAAEAAFGLAANSMSLLADAAHNLGDVLGLLLAWGAARRTVGYGRSSIRAALINATVLLIGVGAIGVEAIQRLFAPQPVAEVTVMVIAAIGILINGGTALLFMRGRENDLNIRGAFLHMASDAVVSLGVVIAALIIKFTGWFWIDPVTSLAIVVVITLGTWGLLRDSVDLAMDAVPGGVAPEAVRSHLAAQPGVSEVHDLHIWGLSTTETALTVHLVCDETAARPHDMANTLQKQFGIGHVTVQVETHEDAELCRLRSDQVV